MNQILAIYFGCGVVLAAIAMIKNYEVIMRRNLLTLLIALVWVITTWPIGLYRKNRR